MLPTRSEPADCNADAQALLDGKGFSCDHVVSVDRDSVLYLNSLGRPRTAWLHRPEHGPLRVAIACGFTIEPPAGWHDKHPGD